MTSVLSNFIIMPSSHMQSYNNTYNFSGKPRRRIFLQKILRKSSSQSASAEHVSDEATLPAAAAPTPKKEEKTVKVKKNNSNAMVVHLGGLAQEPVPTPNDPWYCRRCAAIVSALSSLARVGETVSWKW